MEDYTCCPNMSENSAYIWKAVWMLPASNSDEFPPPPLSGKAFAQTAIPYSILFVIGILGNTAVLVYVYFIIRSLKSSVTALGNTFVYVVALCAVDLLVTVSIPFSLSNTILNNWVFGVFGCKLHWAVELSNKMCSTFILTALAFDRYMAICHPENKRVHQMKQTIAITVFLASLSIALILPVVISATVRSFTGLGYYISQDEEKHSVVKYMCVDGMRRDVKLLVVGFLLVFAFILPCTLITFFYTNIIIRLRRQQRTMSQSRIPVRRITIYTLVVTLFYLFCQIPFWLPQIYGIACMVFGCKIGSSYIILTYYSHLFPFISAAINWIFYARLNSQFKKGLVLVTERLIRKRTRSAQNGASRERDHDDLALDLISRMDDVVAMCPNCEAQLILKPGNGQALSLSVPS
uniref:G_PROTEIN_RECEP_F1_2 domain-containing protein n=1 Tax=Haemonchus contortus TaxID=6289 RepID=A0A7I4Z205_HAECO